MKKNMKKFLILTDDISTYAIYRSLLDTGNVDISFRSSISEALSFTRNRKIDLIIVNLDIPKFRSKYMPTLRKLNKRAPVINIVNEITIRAIEECISINIKVIKQPYKDVTLVELVNDALQTKDIELDNCISIAQLVM